jgi:thymidylate synthase (FAD)
LKFEMQDPLIQAHSLKDLKPQQKVWAALHQDYSHRYVWEEIQEGNLPDEQKAGEIAVNRLLKGGRGHYGPLENNGFTVSVGYAPHSVTQQLRTHRIAVSFDVQCLSGSTEVTFVNCQGSTSKKLKKTMSELYDLWENGETAIRERKVRGRNGEPPGKYRRDCKKRISKMRVRSLDESSNTFTSNYIENVVFNGLNPVYKVTLADGKILECTQNHKIYTPYGWRILSQLAVGSEVMVNGIPLANADKTYQDKNWLESHFSKGLRPKDLAVIAGCSTECIKKWAYVHGLTWDKSNWNKGLKYQIEITPKERDRRRQHARDVTSRRVALGQVPSGPDHPSWKDLPVEKRAYNWLKYNREEVLRLKGQKCSECGSTEKLHCHHIETVKDRPDLAFDMENLQVLCSKCHNRHHKLGKANPLCSHPVKIASIEYKGVEATYDLVMKAPHHNFVANGVVVHNSFRYTSKGILAVGEKLLIDPLDYGPIERIIYLPPAGEYKDRTSPVYEYSEAMRLDDLRRASHLILHYCRRVIDLGVAPQHARGMLPFDYRQHFVVSFNNIRSLWHMADLRLKPDVQPEAQQVVQAIWDAVADECPQLNEWYTQHRLNKARLAP